MSLNKLKLLTPKKGGNRSRSDTPKSASAPASIFQHPTDASPAPSVTGASTAEDDNIIVALQTDQTAIGSAVSNSMSPSTNPIADPSGVPVTSVPYSAHREVTATVESDSGHEDLGREGEATLRAKQAHSLSDQCGSHSDTAIAPARGVAPEAVVEARDTGNRDGSAANDGALSPETKSLAQSAIGALSSITPGSALGVSFASLGANDGPDNQNKPAVLVASPQLDAPKLPAVDREAIDRLEVSDEKAQKQFHQRFSSLAPEDQVINSWSCALQREILIHGRLYLSKFNLCFRAKLFTFETTVVLPLTEVVSLEKRMTALVIPNGLEVATRTSRHAFASILNRDGVFDQIVSVWKLSHPGFDNDETSARDLTALDADLTSDKASVAPTAGAESVRSVETTDTMGAPVKKKKKRGLKVPSFKSLGSRKRANSEADIDEDDEEGEGSGGHAATKCSCEDQHYDTEVLNATFATTPEKMHKLMFDSAFLTKFWAEQESLTEVYTEQWTPSLTDPDGSRSYDYIKPLNASMGPKSTHCLLEDTNDYYDADRAISTLTTTRTPDVPSGNAFSTKTRTCLTWAKSGGCRVVVTTEVDWSKVNRFLRTIVEKSSADGQRAYHKNLAQAARAFIKQNAAEYSAGISDDHEDDVDASDSSSSGGFLGSIISSLPSVSPMLSLVAALVFSNLVMYIIFHRLSRRDPVIALLSDTAARMADLETRMALLRSFATGLPR